MIMPQNIHDSTTRKNALNLNPTQKKIALDKLDFKTTKTLSFCISFLLAYKNRSTMSSPTNASAIIMLHRSSHRDSSAKKARA